MAHHSYEEIRAVFLEWLALNQKSRGLDYGDLPGYIAQVFMKRGSPTRQDNRGYPRLTPDDELTLLDVFWEVFHEGIITFGVNTGGSFRGFESRGLGKGSWRTRTPTFFTM